MATLTARLPKPGNRTIVVVWLVLMAITLLWWLLAPDSEGTATGRGFVVTIVVLGMIKSRLIIRYFMEVRTAPRWLRLGTDAWIVVLWSALLGTYLYR